MQFTSDFTPSRQDALFPFAPLRLGVRFFLICTALGQGLARFESFRGDGREVYAPVPAGLKGKSLGIDL